MRGEVLGVERRRWSDEEKLDIVLSVDRNGETVAQVARQHDLTRQQIYTWRYELTKKGLLSGAQRTRFLPVETDRRDLRRGRRFGSWQLRTRYRWLNCSWRMLVACDLAR